MLRCFGFLLLLCIGWPALGQRLFRVKEFSPKYYGKVWLAKPGEVTSPGWVAVYERKTGRRLLKVESEELYVTRTGGRVKANVHELPYGEQSVLQYADFNFDGIKDFAIEDGHLSCYHGPSFQVFLAQGRNFVPNWFFTELAQEYCGFFGVDYTRRRLTTMTKSGCCWHQFDEYAVRGNQPVLVKSVVEDYEDRPFCTITTTRWQGRRERVSVSYTLNLTEEGVTPLLSFRLAGTGKRLVLVRNSGLLTYTLLQPTGDNVTLRYPAPARAEKSRFWLKTTGSRTTLEFQNGDTRYQVYEDLTPGRPPQLGIRVQTPTRTVDLPGVVASRQGSLAQTKPFDNVLVP